MKQTAVEWYEIEINSLIEKYEAKEISEREFIVMKHNLFYPAKKKEKQQIIDAYKDSTCQFSVDAILTVTTLLKMKCKNDKQIEKEQKDEFAIAFAEWRLTTLIKNADEYTMRELLEIFKTK